MPEFIDKFYKKFPLENVLIVNLCDEEFFSKIGSIPAVVFAMLDVEPVGATAIK